MEVRDRSRSPRSETYEEIVRLVVMRTQARLQKDWNLADTIRTKLTEMGVTLFDKTNSWHSKTGQTGRIPAFSELDAGQPIESIIQEQVMPQANGLSMSHVVLDDSQVRLLVQQREQARAQKDFARSDELRDELKIYGVEVFDKDRMWRAKNGLAGCIIGFHAESGATDLEITTLVVQREKARQSSDFGTADLIRNELRAAGVEIYDKEKVWKIGNGRQGPVPSWQQIQSGGGDVLAQMQAQQQQQGMLSPDMAMAMGMVQVNGDDAMQAQVADHQTEDFSDQQGSAILQLLQQAEQAEPDQQAQLNHQYEQVQQLQQAQQLQLQQLQQLQQAQQLQLLQQSQVAEGLQQQKAKEAVAIGTAMGQALQTMTAQAELQKQQQLQQAQLQQQQLQQLHLQQQLQSLTMAASPELQNKYQLQQLQTLTTATPPPTPPPTTTTTITTTETAVTPELQKVMEMMQDCTASGRMPQDSEIDWLVGIREKLRQARDFATADEIRNALRNNLGVELHEKEKRWATADGQKGFIPLWKDISGQ